KTTCSAFASEPVNLHNEDSDKDSTKEVKIGKDENQTNKGTTTADKKDSKKKDEEDWLARREPNPAKDAQLKSALDLVKDPVKWNQSLGLAAKKPVKTNDKKDKK
ncbi:Ribosomal L28e protein family, partial [Snodgrassella alvi SCGC AB-598-P14]